MFTDLNAAFMNAFSTPLKLKNKTQNVHSELNAGRERVNKKIK